MQAAQEFASLIKTRGRIKTKLTKFSTFVKKCELEVDKRSELPSRIERATELWYEFDKIQTQIENIEDDEVQEGERDAFEDSYHEIITLARQLCPGVAAMDQANPNPPPVNINVPAPVNIPVADHISVKLPTIDLPKFSGNYQGWVSFKDVFNSLIDANPRLSQAQKLHYLKSTLIDEAATVLETLDIVNDNYEVAWDLLNKRFNNKRKIIEHHTQAILNLSTITKESHTALRQLLNDTTKNIDILKKLEEPTDTWDTLLIQILIPKLDSNTLREWERERINKEQIPTMKDFTEFLGNRCLFLESVSRTKQFESTSQSFKTKTIQHKCNSSAQKSTNTSYSYAVAAQPNCILCQGQHRLFKCSVFRNSSIQSRYNAVKKYKLCRNCLNGFHGFNCTFGACKLCKRNHHTLLHIDSTNNGESQPESSTHQRQANPSTEGIPSGASKPPHNHDSSVSVLNVSEDIAVHCPDNNSQYILLSTAMILIEDSSGNMHECRAMLDSGSQSNLITQELSKRLQLPKQKVNTSIRGISRSNIQVNHMVSTNIRSKYNGFQEKITFLTMNTITERLPLISLDVTNLTIPSNITLADPGFHTPGRIDILLGAGIFWKLLCVGQIKASRSQPVLQKTQFGWIVSGAINTTYQPPQRTQSQCYLSVNDMLLNQLEKFWKIEEVDCGTHLSKDEQKCEQHFLSTYSRDETGRFMVELPFKASPSELGESKQIAAQRLQAVERRLQKDRKLEEQYYDFLSEYQQLNHMSEVTSHDTSTISYYLPHHPVFKEVGETKKVRVVFDGSCRTTNGVSLNDILLVGPTIQQDLTSIVFRFRQHKFALSADIAKMYRQILLHPKHRDLQRIFWRGNSSQPIKTFQLNTVTYGLASSPYLAIRCLQQTARDCEHDYPRASKTILTDFYVDDLLTGADELTELLRLKMDIIQVLKTAKLELSKWKSNEGQLIDAISNDPVAVNIGQGTKILGLTWNTQDDTLRYEFKGSGSEQRVTKRMILSNVSQIFDPLGLIGPINIQVKIILQQLWQLKVDWDESVPIELHSAWQRWINQVPIIHDIRIPRRIICDDPIGIELHGFCDASEVAYGACVYIKSIDASGGCSVQLHCAKSRVAPLKNVSVPRLELCGAVLLANLCTKVQTSLSVKFSEIHYWCDSTITLAWIAAESNKWNTFVANRVSEIHRLTAQHNWHHVRSNENPADIISRGIEPNQLSDCSLWWKGPEWLRQVDIDYSSRQEEILSTTPIPERKRECLTTITAVVHDQEDNHAIFTRFSSCIRLKRVIAYCLRFKHNTLHPDSRIYGPLTVEELDDSLTCIVKCVQHDTFSQELRSLRLNKAVSSQSKLVSLNPFLDKNGIIRVGGRLKHASIAYSQKYPIILPGKHEFTTLLIRYEHYRQLHAGSQALMAHLRLNYWIISAKSTIRSVLRKCIVCFRSRPIKFEQLMGNLPSSRLHPARPFVVSGVDYAGPFSIKVSRNVTGKAYLCLFICFTTRAVHLELVSSLTTESFLNALKRFIARRGKCHTLHSDNGTNFVGADAMLKDIVQTLPSQSGISDFLSEHSIKWKFIPPYSPHMGGLWEAGIKSAKIHLRKILGSTVLNFEELYTLFTQIESCLNSRPLTPISNDPLDLEPLTPAHFLVGGSLTTIPEEDLLQTPINRLTRWGLLIHLKQQFWKRWSREYISLMQQRNKWRRSDAQLVPGMMVLLRDDHAPSMTWPLGRILSVHPGDDGLVRVVTVKTRTGVYQRSAAKICVLPIDDNQGNETQ